MGLDRYRLLAQLGAGCDGISYRAVAEDGADGDRGSRSEPRACECRALGAIGPSNPAGSESRTSFGDPSPRCEAR